MADFDPEFPGCAPEMCGGVSYDPCGTVLRTRGRWHDGEVPPTAADAVAQVLAGHAWWDGVCWESPAASHVIDGSDEAWRAHVAPLIAAAVADWLRAQPVQLQLRDPQKYGYTNAARWAAGILDGRTGV